MILIHIIDITHSSRELRIKESFDPVIKRNYNIKIKLQYRGDTEKSADKEKEKDQAKTCSKLLSTLQLNNPFERKVGEPNFVTIPTIYLVHITSKACPLLTFSQMSTLRMSNSPLNLLS
jgi:hypothetical protein